MISTMSLFQVQARLQHALDHVRKVGTESEDSFTSADLCVCCGWGWFDGKIAKSSIKARNESENAEGTCGPSPDGQHLLLSDVVDALSTEAQAAREESEKYVKMGDAVYKTGFTAGAEAQREADALVAYKWNIYAGAALRSAPLCQPGDRDAV